MLADRDEDLVLTRAAVGRWMRTRAPRGAQFMHRDGWSWTITKADLDALDEIVVAFVRYARQAEAIAETLRAQLHGCQDGAVLRDALARAERAEAALGEIKPPNAPGDDCTVELALECAQLRERAENAEAALLATPRSGGKWGEEIVRLREQVRRLRAAIILHLFATPPDPGLGGLRDALAATEIWSQRGTRHEPATMLRPQRLRRQEVK